MCGIAGVFDLGGNGNKPDIRKMTNAMSHRGPDAEGFYFDENISLGHRRLSIIDLSDAANQPLKDNSGRYVIVFNGEIYNFHEVRKELTGYAFQTNGDTEVILAAFSTWGPGCVHKLKGMFAFAVWDTIEHKLYVFRDRMGVKPLYYFHDNSYFIFSSEMRSLLASGLIERKLNRGSLGDYLTYQSFGPECPIPGIRQLNAGAYLTVDRLGCNEYTYWQFPSPDNSINMGDAADVRSMIRDLFEKSVKQRLVSDVPVGAFLSGGIDSSAVVAMMAKVSSGKPVTFHISFQEEGFDEAAYADLVAKKYGTDHRLIRLSDEVFLDQMEMALNAMDSPSADGVNTYVVSKAIRDAGITVALSGIGGDELFAGYPFFSTMSKIISVSGIFNAALPVRKLLAGAMGLIPIRSDKFQRATAMISERTASATSMYTHFRTIMTPGNVKRFTNTGWNGHTALQEQLHADESFIAGFPNLSQVSICEYMGYTQHTLLKAADQMSMAVALEVREPFFDHDLIEFVMRVPDELKKPIYPKALLVESLGDMLPREVVFRKKQGFLFPWKIWMRKQLFEFCDARMRRICERDYINGKQLMGRWMEFVHTGKGASWTEMWSFVVLENWMEKEGVE